jgi:hypothetical protein
MHPNELGTKEWFGRQSDEGDLHVWGGIVSARLSDLASALDTTPEKILRAVDAEGIAPLFDTGVPKGRGSDTDRPTDPELRCLAFTVEDFKALTGAVGTEGREAVPA